MFASGETMASGSPLAQLVIKAGHHDRFMCPVEVSVGRDALDPALYAALASVQRNPAAAPGNRGLARPKQGEGSPTWIKLLREDLSGEIPCQVITHSGEDDAVAIRFILEHLSAGEEERLLVVAATPDENDTADRGQVELIPDDAELRVLIDGEYFTSYVFDDNYAKPFLGPILGPYGHWITRLDHETREHPHQRSMWVAIGDVNQVDVWNEPAGRHGKQLHKGFAYIDSGPVSAEFRADNVWTAFDGTPLIDETRTISIYRTPAWLRIVDLDIEFKAEYGAVVFGRTKEAGPLGIRVAESMKVTNGGVIENSVGSISEKETWGKRAHWCDYSGSVEGHRVGIAVFDHPDNPGHPTHWHVRDYGLMAPNNFYFTGPLSLEKGERLRYRYRAITHLGGAKEGRVGERYHDYINKPSVVITRA